MTQAQTDLDLARKSRGLAPGSLAVVFSVILFASLTTYRLASAVTEPAAIGQASEIATVADSDLDAALNTVDGSKEFLSGFRRQEKRCPAPLAWVSLWTSANRPPVKVRIRSANYYSPVITVTDKPARIAIPFPGPYESGHGSLTVMQAGEISIALRPVWHLPAASANQRHDVTWTPVSHCDTQHG